MEKLDRLGWAAGISFRAYGLTLGVRVNDRGVLDRVVEHLPYGWKPSPKTHVQHLYSVIAGTGEQIPRPGARFGSRLRRFHQLYSSSQQIARTLVLDDLLELFESDIRLLVGEHAKTRVFVHAGVVAWKNQAILIPGRSFSGKTSLVAEFVRAGAVYYSDEFALLDARGRVHPYLKPLAVREGETGKQTNYDVETFGGVSGTRPIPVGAVIVTEYREGTRWRPKLLSPGLSVLELLSNTVSARRSPDRALPALQAAASHALTLKGRRGEASAIVDAILSRLD